MQAQRGKVRHATAGQSRPSRVPVPWVAGEGSMGGCQFANLLPRGRAAARRPWREQAAVVPGLRQNSLRCRPDGDAVDVRGLPAHRRLAGARTSELYKRPSTPRVLLPSVWPAHSRVSPAEPADGLQAEPVVRQLCAARPSRRDLPEDALRGLRAGRPQVRHASGRIKQRQKREGQKDSAAVVRKVRPEPPGRAVPRWEAQL